MGKCLQTSGERKKIFKNVQMCCIFDLCILTTPVFRLIVNYFKGTIQEGPTSICDFCWKLKFRRNVMKLKERRYQTYIYNECTTGKSDWIRLDL